MMRRASRRVGLRRSLGALRRRLAAFLLERRRRRTRPLPTEAFKARIEIAGAVPQFRVAEAARLAVAVTNNSPAAWPGGGLVALSYRWHRADGAPWTFEGDRVALPRAMAPGEVVRLECHVRTPNTPARYVLELDLVYGEARFGAFGSEVLREAVPVAGMRPESLADIDFEQAYAAADLVRDYWTPVGPSSPEEFRRLGLAKLELLEGLGLTPRSRVLDVGCGTGSLTEALAAFLHDEGRYYGTDISEVAVRFCRRRYTRPNFDFARNGMTTLPLRDPRFDFIVFFSVFTHTYAAETRALLAEAGRLLAAGGSVVADVFESDLDGGPVGNRAMIVLPRGAMAAMAEELGLRARTVSEFVWDAQEPRRIDRVMRSLDRRDAVTAP